MQASSVESSLLLNGSQLWLYHNWLMILTVNQAYVDSNSTSHPKYKIWCVLLECSLVGKTSVSGSNLAAPAI